MTWTLFTRRPYIEYVAVSIDVGKHADIDANDLNQVRKGMAQHWSGDKDVIRIGSTGRFVTGYVGFDRAKGLYFWVDSMGRIKSFDPRTGRLGMSVKIPARERKLIYDEETWQLREGYIKKRTMPRK